MTKCEILFFMKVVDPCCSVPKKQTTHKTKLYSSGYTQNTKQYLDSNSWLVTVQYSLMSNFEFLWGRTGFYFLLSWGQNWILLFTQNLQPRVLAFQRDQSRLKWSSITPDIVKNLKRGRIVTVQFLDSNSWIITIQCLLMSNFDCLGGRTRFSFIHRTCSLMSQLSNETNLT